MKAVRLLAHLGLLTFKYMQDSSSNDGKVDNFKYFYISPSRQSFRMTGIAMRIGPTLDGLSGTTSQKWIDALISSESGAVFLVSSPDAHLLDRISSESAIEAANITVRKVALLRQPDPEIEDGDGAIFTSAVARIIQADEPCVVVLPEIFDMAGFKAACNLARGRSIVIAGFLSRNSLATLRRLNIPNLEDDNLVLIRGSLATRGLPSADSPESVLLSELRIYNEASQILLDVKQAEVSSGDMNFVKEAVQMADAGVVTVKALEDRFLATDIADARLCLNQP